MLMKSEIGHQGVQEKINNMGLSKIQALKGPIKGINKIIIDLLNIVTNQPIKIKIDHLTIITILTKLLTAISKIKDMLNRRVREITIMIVQVRLKDTMDKTCMEEINLIIDNTTMINITLCQVNLNMTIKDL